MGKTPPPEDDSDDVKRRKRLEQAADFYLHACYGTRTAARAEEFAEYLRLTRPYLSRRVPELIGKSVLAFLRERQLAYAQKLLRTTPLAVEEIARAAAFGTAWTFNRCFREAFATTPAKYRQQEARSARDQATGVADTGSTDA